MNLWIDWRLQKATSIADLADSLPETLHLGPSHSCHEKLTVYDDFNGTIWRAGLALLSDDSGWLSLWQKNQQILTTRMPQKNIRFWWQLPAGDLAEKLEKLIAIRAFTPRYKCLISTERLNVLNHDEKIVTRIELYRLEYDDSQPMFLVSLLGLRGYEEDFSRILKSLSPLNPQEVDRLTLRQLLAETGLQTAEFSPVPKFNLLPEEPSEVAVSRMAEIFLSSARQYEAGILADIDTEFVHQYRVNIRKAWSVINQFKNAYTAQRYQELKTGLKILGSRTNTLRDLDVFLLAQDQYINMLPEHLRPGLDALYRRIKRRRTMAFKKVIEALDCAEYQLLVEQISQTLQQKPELATKLSKTGIRSAVCHEGLSLYLKISTKGKNIDAETPDGKIHELRILGKKLRYLLELFGELFPRRQIKQLVGDLKKIQDNLGRFNDYSVQGLFMANIGQEKNITDEQRASIYGLVAVLYNKQNQERSLVETRLAQFCNSQVVDEFQKLFSQPFAKDSEK